MPQANSLTVNFNDGSQLTFDFPEQGGNAAAKQLKVEDFLKGQHLVVEAEGKVLVIPVANIKYISLNTPAMAGKAPGLPRHALRGARIRT